MEIIIEPLSEKTLRGTLSVLDKVFGHNQKDKEMYHNAFPGSLDREQYKLLFGKKEKPTYLQYYVTIDKGSNKVVGTTGLYAYTGDSNKRFGTGWFCVDPTYRGKGIGKLLLDFTIDKARKLKRKILHLWTSMDPIEQTANKMYEKRGFVITKRERLPDQQSDIIYMELKL